MGQKMVRFEALRNTRSRQGESIEVSRDEVGSKRPSLGGTGGHVVSLYPLTWRSLSALSSSKLIRSRSLLLLMVCMRFFVALGLAQVSLSPI
jgi:hypothetical protein